MTGIRAEVIAIGSELLESRQSESNGTYLARRLGGIGLDVRFRTIVGDSIDDIREAFRVALGRSDVILATGGLGPTVDDLTREALASLLDLPLVEDRAIVREIENRFRRYGVEMPPSNLRQAQVPQGAEPLPNRHGTAPGLFLKTDRAVLVLLPGVPQEMRQIMEDAVMPRLGSVGKRYATRILKIAGLAESEVDRRLEDVARRAGEVAWTILGFPGQVEIHLRERLSEGETAAGIERIEREIEAILGLSLFARDGVTMEETVGRLLVDRGATLAVAESLTGGFLSARMTSVPGSSRYFAGGIVCYTEAAKRDLLGVRERTLKEFGVVSREVAVEMAERARDVLGSTWGLSATGYAGPEGGGGDQPPGTVMLGLSGPGSARVRALLLPGDREGVRTRAAQAALDLLRRALLGAET
jgi:competence/damage-inducible protein CinA-like protein